MIKRIAFISLSALIIAASCKKKEDPEPKPDPVAVEKAAAAESDGGQTGSDNREVQEENDVAVNEVNDIISKSKRMGGRSSVMTDQMAGPCDLDIDSVKISQDTILLKYNGISCNKRTRTGIIRLTWAQNTKWKVAGAVIKIEYLNYKVVRTSDQKSFTLNGTQQLKNESGGTWVDLVLSSHTLITTVSGTNLQVTFSDNKTAVYNINGKATYTFPGGILTAKLEGIGSNGTLNQLENFGTTRNGDNFTSEVTTPIVWNMSCGSAVIQGAVKITNTSKNFSVTFLYGVDQNGNIQTVGANACPYGWKFEWPGVGGTKSKVFGYK